MHRQRQQYRVGRRQWPTRQADDLDHPSTSWRRGKIDGRGSNQVRASSTQTAPASRPLRHHSAHRESGRPCIARHVAGAQGHAVITRICTTIRAQSAGPAPPAGRAHPKPIRFARQQRCAAVDDVHLTGCPRARLKTVGADSGHDQPPTPSPVTSPAAILCCPRSHPR